MKINSEIYNENHLILYLIGEIILSEEEIIKQAFDNNNLAKFNNILLDFSQISHINSAGLGLLIEVILPLYKQGKQIKFIITNSYFQRIFRMVGLLDYGTFYETLENALVLKQINVYK